MKKITLNFKIFRDFRFHFQNNNLNKKNLKNNKFMRGDYNVKTLINHILYMYMK